MTERRKMNMKYPATHHSYWDDSNTFFFFFLLSLTPEGHGNVEEKQKLKGNIRCEMSDTAIMLFQKFSKKRDTLVLLSHKKHQLLHFNLFG